MKSDGVFLGDVIERPTTVPKALGVKSPACLGFPQVQIPLPAPMQRNKVTQPKTPSDILSQAALAPSGDYLLSSEDNARNSEIVASMSKTELQAAIQEINTTFSAKSLEYLMQRKPSTTLSPEKFDRKASRSHNSSESVGHQKPSTTKPSLSSNDPVEVANSNPSGSRRQNDRFDLSGRKVSSRTEFIKNIREAIGDNDVFSVMSCTQLDTLSTLYVNESLKVGLISQPIPDDESPSYHTIGEVCQVSVKTDDNYNRYGYNRKLFQSYSTNGVNPIFKNFYSSCSDQRRHHSGFWPSKC